MMRYLNSRKHIAAASVFALSTALIALPAMAENDSQHLRGQITSVSDSGFTMMTRSGDKRQIKMSSKTRLAAVMPGNLSNIEKGTYIGTANVKRNGENRALEMVIFPASMKGSGLGNYPWDLTPAMAANETPGKKTDMGSQVSKSGGSMSSGSSMTNGTVSSKMNSSDSSTVAKTAPKGQTGSQVDDSASNNSGSSMTAGSSMTNGTVSSKMSGSNSSTVAKTAPKGQTGSQVDDSASNNSGSSMSAGSSMTNGTVKQEQGGSNQSMTLKVDYGTGSKTIVVPADTPTVKVRKGEKSDLVKGAHVFVAGTPKGDSVNAQFVAVGVNGTVPPM